MTELYHHGVKGQKWGVRRKQKTAAKKASKAIARKQMEDYRKRDSLSNAELKKRIDRISMENQLYKLSKEAVENNKSAGHKFITDYMSSNKGRDTSMSTAGDGLTATRAMIAKKKALKLAAAAAV